MDPVANSRRFQGVSLIEWRHTGHRLSYVRGIVDAAASQGIGLQILTQASAVESSEWEVHLGGLRGVAVKTFNPTSFSGRHLPNLLRTQRREGRAVVLPEVDRVLPAVLVALATRALPRSTTIIAMRPPSWSFPRKWPASLFKIVALRLLASTNSVNVLVLEDQLAHGQTRIWRWPLSNSALRLDDPADPPADGNDLPPELNRLPPTTKLIALVGTIDERKRAPLVLDGWAMLKEGEDRSLVIAGPQTEAIRSELANHPAFKRGDVIMIDRYVLLTPIVQRSIGLLVLFDGGLSSATLISAAQSGRWAITATGGRPARVAAEHGFGIEALLTPKGIRSAIDAAFGRQTAPNPVRVSGRTAFGSRVLEATLDQAD